jgi:hypothetical protein
VVRVIIQIDTEDLDPIVVERVARAIAVALDPFNRPNVAANENDHIAARAALAALAPNPTKDQSPTAPYGVEQADADELWPDRLAPNPTDEDLNAHK